MMQGTHVAGLAGLIMLVVGAGLYLTGSTQQLNLLYWLGGPLLCAVGGALLMGSILWRVYYVRTGTHNQGDQKESHPL